MSSGISAAGICLCLLVLTDFSHLVLFTDGGNPYGDNYAGGGGGSAGGGFVASQGDGSQGAGKVSAFDFLGRIMITNSRLSLTLVPHRPSLSSPLASSSLPHATHVPLVLLG